MSPTSQDYCNDKWNCLALYLAQNRHSTYSSFYYYYFFSNKRVTNLISKFTFEFHCLCYLVSIHISPIKPYTLRWPKWSPNLQILLDTFSSYFTLLPCFCSLIPHSPKVCRKGYWKHMELLKHLSMGSLSPLLPKTLSLPLIFKFCGSLNVPSSVFSSSLLHILPDNFNLFLAFNCNLHAHNPKICLVPSHLS